MKKLLLAALLMLSAPLGAQSAARSLPDWMAGTWVHEDGANWSDEIWTDARGGLMLGIARTGFGPKLNTWEIAQIRRGPGGAGGGRARPRGGPAGGGPGV